VPVCVLPTYRVLMEKYTIHKNTVPKVPIVLNSDGARPLRAHLHRFIPTYCSLPLAVRVLLDAVTRRQLHLLFPPCCCSSSSPCYSPLLIPSSSCSSLLLLVSCSWFLVPGSWFCFCFCFPSPSLTCAERARYRNAGLSCRLEYSNRIINTRQIEPPRGPAAHHCAFIPTCTAGQPHSHLPDQTSAVFPSTVRPPARAPVSLAPSFPASCHTVGLGACSGEVSNLCGGDDDDYEYDDDDDDDVILLHPSPSPNRPDQPWFNSQRFPSHSRDTPDSYRLVHRSFPNSVLQRVASCSIRYTLYK